MLTKGDEYPIHQTPEPVAYAGSDRNFYDRFFFNGYSKDGSVFFGAALGVYPHLNIMDGAFSILKDGVQHSVHVSRVLGMERMDTQVGPLSVEVVEGLKQIRLRFVDAEGIDVDLVFTGRHFPIEEPRFTYRQGPRMLIDCTRMTQNGRWSGHIKLDGETIEVFDFYGTRDRSWGVRPIGERDAQPVIPIQMPQYFWIWAPVNFGNVAHYFHVNEDAGGHAWNTRAVLASDNSGHDDLNHMVEPQIDIEWTAGTRRIESATLGAEDTLGRTHKVQYEPQSVFQMKGIGYGHPEWGHGAFKGGFAIERESFTPSELAWNDLENLHIQAISKVRHEGPDGIVSEGIGVVEQLCLGPHKTHGWKDILDV